MRDYTTHAGLPESVAVHRLSNIAGELHAGENCRIDAFTTITGTVTLGKNVHIATGVSIFGGAGVAIGDDTSISPGAMIFTASFDRETGYRVNPQLADKKYSSGPVKIGARCIVGAGSVVLPNVTLDDDVLIGALSLVKRDLVAGLYAGAPVRLLQKEIT